MRVTSLVAGITALVLLVGDTAGGETKKSELEGTWRATTLAKNGKEQEDTMDHNLTFEGKYFTLKRGDMVMAAGTFKTDRSKKPREIDMLVTEGKDDFKGKTAKAIYEIKGDTLRWCVAEPGTDRPTEFAAPEGAKVALITLKREKK
jgi:uncharacterized protein (TIGR03067 family)